MTQRQYYQTASNPEAVAAESKQYPTELIRRLIPGLLIGFLAFLVLILVGDLNNVSDQVISFKWQLFPFFLLLFCVNYFLRFIKWHFYLGQIDIDNLPVKESATLLIHLATLWFGVALGVLVWVRSRYLLEMNNK